MNIAFEKRFHVYRVEPGVDYLGSAAQAGASIIP